MMLLLKALFLFTVFGLGNGLEANPPGSPQSLTDKICPGRPRTYCEVQLDVPSSCVNVACPIVFFLHGSGGNIQGYAQRTGVHSANMIGVYPQGERGWNTGPKPGNTCAWNNYECQDDPDEGDYIAAIISEIRSLGATGNIYVIGSSNGAALAHRLASNAGDALPIKGIVAKVTQLLSSPNRSGPGVLNYNQPRSGAPAVSVLSIMGTDDPLIPYEGGSSNVFGGDQSFQLMDSVESMETWSSHNGCDGTVSIDYNYVTDQGTGRAIKYDYSGGCSSGILLEHYAIEGGGHNAGGASINGEKVDYVISYDFINRVENGSDEPTPTSPVQPPVASPPTTSSCVNDPEWAGKFNPSHTCAYVGEDPSRRCNWESSDGTKANDACVESCGSCSSPTAPTQAPIAPVASPTDSPVASPPTTSSCVDDPEWAGKFNPPHTCAYVGEDPI